MPLYYEGHFMGALVLTAVWLCLGPDDTWFLWLLKIVIQGATSPSCNSTTQRRRTEMRRRLQHLPGSPRMLVDVFQCLPRAGLDACQLVSRQFRDAVEDARATLPLYSMVVSLHSSTPLVAYVVSIDDVGSVAGHFFTGLRRCDSPYFRNAAIELRGVNATYARMSTDMVSAFVRWLNLDERNIRFTDLKCEAYAGELDDLFLFTDRHNISSIHVSYKRSLIAPGCDFLSMLFREARNRQLIRLTVSLEFVKAKNCDIELQVGLQVLSEIFQDQERPSAEDLTVIVPRLKGFHLLRRIEEAYARREIIRPITIGCDSSVSLAELWHRGVFPFLVGKEFSADGRKYATMDISFNSETNFYEFFLS